MIQSYPGTSTCNGDSGGGMYFEDDNGIYHLRGIVSIAKSRSGVDNFCNPNEYVVFTDAAKYRNWIQDKIKLNIWKMEELCFISYIDLKWTLFVQSVFLVWQWLPLRICAVVLEEIHIIDNPPRIYSYLLAVPIKPDDTFHRNWMCSSQVTKNFGVLGARLYVSVHERTKRWVYDLMY